MNIEMKLFIYFKNIGYIEINLANIKVYFIFVYYRYSEK
jgi:hypothetical protein